MKLLLDTHALLWWLSDDARIMSRARGLIADPANDVLVSAVSLWEIVVKMRVGKLVADVADVVRVMERQGFTWLDIGASHLVTLAGLRVDAAHRDPFDHLLIAQAIAEDASFLTDDRHATRYPVRVVACTD